MVSHSSNRSPNSSTYPGSHSLGQGVLINKYVREKRERQYVMERWGRREVESFCVVERGGPGDVMVVRNMPGWEPVLPHEAMKMSRSGLLQSAMFGSMDLLQLVFVLMSMACVTAKGQVNVCGLYCCQKPPWCQSNLLSWARPSPVQCGEAAPKDVRVVKLVLSLTGCITWATQYSWAWWHGGGRAGLEGVRVGVFSLLINLAVWESWTWCHLCRRAGGLT